MDVRNVNADITDNKFPVEYKLSSSSSQLLYQEPIERLDLVYKGIS